MTTTNCSGRTAADPAQLRAQGEARLLVVVPLAEAVGRSGLTVQGLQAAGLEPDAAGRVDLRALVDTGAAPQLPELEVVGQGRL